MMGAEIENKKVELRVFTSVGFSDPSILIVYSGDIVLGGGTNQLIEVIVIRLSGF